MKTLHLIAILFGISMCCVLTSCGKNMVAFSGSEQTIDQRASITQSMDAEVKKADNPEPALTATATPTPEIPKTFADTKLVCEKVNESPLIYGCALRFNDGTKYSGKVDKWDTQLNIEELQEQGSVNVENAAADSVWHIFLTPGPSIRHLIFKITSGAEMRKYETEIENNQVPAPAPEGAAVPGFKLEENFWYLSKPGESCEQVCANHGGYNDATRTVAGSDGSSLKCQLTFLGISKGTVGFEYLKECPTAGLGCYIKNGKKIRCGMPSNPTTAEASAEGVERACSCFGD